VLEVLAPAAEFAVELGPVLAVPHQYYLAYGTLTKAAALMQTWWKQWFHHSFHWVDPAQPLVGLDSDALVAFAIFEMLPGPVCVVAPAAALPFVLALALLVVLAFLIT
jgi:hypothetical protein